MTSKFPMQNHMTQLQDGCKTPSLKTNYLSALPWVHVLVGFLIFLTLPLSQGQKISETSLRRLFKLKEVAYDPENQKLKASWPLRSNQELDSLDQFGGALCIAQPGTLTIPPYSGFRWREVRFEAPFQVSFEAQPWRKSSIFEMRILDVSETGREVVAFLNKPIRSGAEQAKRRDGFLRVKNNRSSPTNETAESSQRSEAWSKITLIVTETQIEFRRDSGPPLLLKYSMQGLFQILMISRRGGVRIRELQIEGCVAEQSLRKLLDAGRSSRSDSKKPPQVGLAFRSLKSLYTIAALERHDSYRFVRDLIKRGYYAPGRPKTKDAQLLSLIKNIFRRSMFSQIPKTISSVNIKRLQRIKSIAKTESYFSFLRYVDEYGRGKRTDAKNTLRKCVKRSPKFAAAWRALGALYLEEYRDEKALACFEMARKHDSDSAWGLAFMGLTYVRLSNFEKGRALLSAAKRKAPNSIAIDDLIGYAKTLSKGPFSSRSRTRRSKKYLIESNLQKEELEQLGSYLDHYRELLETEIPLTKKPRHRSRVWLFNSEEEYLSFSSTLTSRPENTLGHYHPTLNTLLLFASMDSAQNRQTLLHEAFHQYLEITVSAAPMWFNEGMAEYYGATSFDDQWRVKSGGIVRGRLSELRRLIDHGDPLVPMHKLMLMKRAKFMGPSVGLHYAQSWAMIHFFKHDKSKIYSAKFAQYLEAVMAGEGLVKAHALSFGKDSIAEDFAMSKAWRNYLTKTLLPQLESERPK